MRGGGPEAAGGRVVLFPRVLGGSYGRRAGRGRGRLFWSLDGARLGAWGRVDFFYGDREAEAAPERPPLSTPGATLPGSGLARFCRFPPLLLVEARDAEALGQRVDAAPPHGGNIVAVAIFGGRGGRGLLLVLPAEGGGRAGGGRGGEGPAAGEAGGGDAVAGAFWVEGVGAGEEGLRGVFHEGHGGWEAGAPL